MEKIHLKQKEAFSPEKQIEQLAAEAADLEAQMAAMPEGHQKGALKHKVTELQKKIESISLDKKRAA
jgi:hypothetical protein